MLQANGAEALVVAKLDRLSRSVVDFGKLLAEAQSGNWGFVVLDMDLDMTTAAGRMVAGVLMQFAQFERELTSERTKAALAVKRASGARLGRRSQLSQRVIDRIRREHESGTSMRAIATGLNEDAIPTGQGGAQWHASTVRSVLQRTEGE
jgi:DNA invertase Pin-like site-specific DNA recombinase